MNIVTIILLVFAFVLFAVAALGVPSPPRFNLLAAGLAFWVLSLLLTGVVHAQPTPQHPHDQRAEDRAWLREQHMSPQWDDREHRREERSMRRYCADWRARVERHPRMILPRECWRR